MRVLILFILNVKKLLIKRIPQWNENLIEEETKRIRSVSRCEFIENLLKAVIKSNIILLSNSNNSTINKSIEKKFLDIPLNKFIHKCYIEAARQFYNTPYLFYHDIKAIDKKRNQRDCYDIIKSSIREAIRKILPVQDILSNYLGKNSSQIENDEIDKPISIADSDNLKQLVSKDLEASFEKKSNKITEISYDEKYEENQQNLFDSETMKLLTEIKSNFIKNENINSEEVIKIDELKIDNSNNIITKVKVIDSEAEYNELNQNKSNNSIAKETEDKCDLLNQEKPKSIIDSVKSSNNFIEINNASKLSENINSKFLTPNHKLEKSQISDLIPKEKFDERKMTETNNELNSFKNFSESERILSEKLSENLDLNNSEVITDYNNEAKKINNKNETYSQSEIKKNSNIDSESSIAYNDNDDKYEDVFSNILDSDSSNLESTINKLINSENDKKKNKNKYFSNLSSF